jgi:glycosyltransferase involved in cell wall biosynthesis
LSSIHGVVDEIVVLDTGSLDDSVDIARKFGARVFHHQWNHDFSEARNAALDRARGDWILYIDADERLVEPDRGTIEALLTESSAVAFRLELRPGLESSAYLEYRIWRNDPQIRFEGIIHETHLPAIDRVARRDGSTVEIAPLLIQHVGYEGDQRRKHNRNLPLLRRELERNRENLFVRHHLFRVLDALGRPEEAESVLVEALAVTRRHDQGGQVDYLGSLIYADLIRLRLERGEDADALLAEARDRHPDNCALMWMESRLLLNAGHYEEAIDRLDQLVEVAGRHEPSVVAYEQRMLTEAPHEVRGLCLFRLGRYTEAAAEYEQAARFAPNNASYPVKRELALARARRANP